MIKCFGTIYIKAYTHNCSLKMFCRFHLKKGGTTNVHTLLQKMFQEELQGEQKNLATRATVGENTQFDSFN